MMIKTVTITTRTGLVLGFCLAAPMAMAADVSPAPRVVENSGSIYVEVNHPKAADTNPGTADLPFKTISAAVLTAGPGATVLIKGGIYRETVLITKSGTKDKSIVIKGVPGERVLITGADPITGWKRCTKEEAFGNEYFDQIYMTEVVQEEAPSKLIESSLKHTVYTMSRLPTTGLWKVESAPTPHSITDATHLTSTDPKAFAGWTLMAFNQASSSAAAHTAFTYDPQKHQLTLEKRWCKWADVNPGRDTYWFENHPAAISAAGQFAYQKTEKGWRCWVWPLTMKDNQPVIEQLVRRACLTPDKVSFIVIDGLEACFSASQGIGPAVHLADCIIQNCYIHDCSSYGIGLTKSDRMTVRRTILREVARGIVQDGGSDCLVEENDIGWCHVDGMDSANGVRNLRIRRNFVHDNFRFGHPDNLQFWTNVDGVWVEDNVLLNGGQSFMSIGMKNTHVINNLIIGSHSAGVILRGESGIKVYKMTTSYKKPYDKPEVRSPLVKEFEAAAPDVIEFTHNTLCATALSPTNWGGTGFAVHDNVIAPLHAMPLYQINSLRTAAVDNNLLWPGVVNDRIAYITDITKTGEGDQALLDMKTKRVGFPALQELGLEKNGMVTDPQFINAPKFYVVSYYAELAASTRNKLILWGQVGNNIAVGDHVEIGFDGVVRTVTAVGTYSEKEAGGKIAAKNAPGKDNPDDQEVPDPAAAEKEASDKGVNSTIAFDPPLKVAPDFAVSVANWGDKTDFTWNLQLKDTSPGHNKARDGKDMGCNLKLQNYIKGDFDGDGKRDLPEMPKE